MPTNPIGDSGDADPAIKGKTIHGQSPDPPTRLMRHAGAEMAAGIKAESDVPLDTPINTSGPNFLPFPSFSTVEQVDVVGYEIIAELGRGGMGVVYKARHRRLNRLVALKMILAGGHASPVDLQRFLGEGEAVAALQHQNIVQVYEIGQQNGLPYMALEFVEGDTLAKRLKGTPLPPRQAARLVVQLAEGMQAAHQAGIVHRDLKPGNVLLKMPDRTSSDQTSSTDTQSGPAVDLQGVIFKITDFGLAKNVQTESGLTVTGAVMGTPSYMAPEQASGGAKRVGPAVDIYALGAILYECLTGRPPFQGPTALDTLMQVKREDPVSPSRLQPKTPRDVETICLKCLNKEPNKRYTSAAALAEDLKRYLSDRPILARASGPVEKTWRWCRRNPILATLTASVALLFLLSAIGSSIAALLLENERQKLALANENLQKAEEKERLAKKDALEKLWKTYLAQARAERWSGQPGRRFYSLEALAQAAAIKPSVELRNEAIACLALPDLRAEKKWQEMRQKQDISSHLPFVFDAAFKTYARADAAGNIWVCRTTDDGELAHLPTPSDPAWLLQFSPDGRRLAVKYHHRNTPGQNRLCIWDINTKKAVLEVEGMAHVAMDFSPDGRAFVRGHQDGSIWRYDLDGGADKKQLCTGAPAHSLRLSADGTRLAVSSLETPEVRVCSTIDGEVLHVLKHGGAVRGLSWVDDGTMLACACKDFQVYVWNMKGTPRIQTILKGHDHEVTHVALTHRGGLLASTGWDSTFRLWDPFTGKQHLTAPMLGPLQFRDDDRKLGFFEVANSSVLRRHYLGERVASYEVNFDNDGRLLANGMPDGAQIWDMATQKEIAYLRKAKGIWSVLFHPDGKRLITCGASGLHQWTMTTARPGEIRLGLAQELNPASLWRASLSQDGSLLAVVTNQGRALVYDLNKLASPVVTGLHPGVAHVAISPDNRLLATGAWQGVGVIIWDCVTGKQVHKLPISSSAEVEFSPDGKWLVSATAEKTCLWETGTWQPGLSLPRKREGPVAFSPRGDLLAIAHSLRLIRLIDPHGGQELATLETPYPVGMSCLRFSRDGSQLAAATDYMTQVWDLRQLRRELSALNLDWQQQACAAGPLANVSPLRIVLEDKSIK